MKIHFLAEYIIHSVYKSGEYMCLIWHMWISLLLLHIIVYYNMFVPYIFVYEGWPKHSFCRLMPLLKSKCTKNIFHPDTVTLKVQPRVLVWFVVEWNEIYIIFMRLNHKLFIHLCIFVSAASRLVAWHSIFHHHNKINQYTLRTD